ncbi:ornithine--oxo-acid transaminase [Methylomarinovum caldicuralii]|uniref:Ornithine--oxo-acid transaminase n=1 Tax=Methylomarinovum caldicuralii TaxID=438856 RepID=A0AAU9C1S7_9GAMM|nr:aspartate aminotransferase family protein [Methylomarinovum caldicuralii]BCX81538.1 ornithine--oxo-acid transaminase [Methylomarinovum caldicuralii]
MTLKLADLIATRRRENFTLHEQYLNPQMVRVLRTIGYDRVYTRAEGPYLFDDQGNRYLDLLSGFGVFALGRNHPTVKAILKEVLDLDLPDLVQMDVSLLAGVLAEKLVERTPEPLTRLFFCNSGAEAVEAAIKFARYTTGRSRILYCEHAFHGLTMGALSLNGEEIFRQGFGPLLPDCDPIPFNDLEALERALKAKETAAFIVEPIQGKGVNLPDDDYLAEAARLCHRHGALFVADEIQTGLGRTGRLWAIDHWNVEPDMLLMAKALSGGFVPVGAVAMTRRIMDKVFNRMDRAVVHGSTFSKNNMAMAAGLATLEVLESEHLMENAARQGEALLAELGALVDRYEFFHQVRGKGLMLALEFGKPESFKLKTAWNLLETANKGLFSQMVTIPLFKKHRILSQVAGHGMNVVKFLPPLVIGDDDRRWIVTAMDDVLADCHQVPGAIWDLGRTLAGHALKARKSA